MQLDYQKAVQYVNGRDAASVVLAARRLLEGMTHQFLPPGDLKKKLATDLATLQRVRDLSPVLVELSGVLKDAGNIGAHFGASRVTSEIAHEALSLAEELLQLHYLLKSRVEALRELVSQATGVPVIQN
jgi:hypothetical protein